MMLPDSEGRGRMSETRGIVLLRVEGIDELIPKEFFERRRYERITLSAI
jgi:hypothetical protein